MPEQESEIRTAMIAKDRDTSREHAAAQAPRHPRPSVTTADVCLDDHASLAGVQVATDDSCESGDHSAGDLRGWRRRRGRDCTASLREPEQHRVRATARGIDAQRARARRRASAVSPMASAISAPAAVRVAAARSTAGSVGLMVGRPRRRWRSSDRRRESRAASDRARTARRARPAGNRPRARRSPD